MSPNTEKENLPEIIYDANASQRYEFEVIEDGKKFDTAHIYAPLPDERYISYVRSVKAKGNDDESDDNVIEINRTLWDELVTEVENLDTEGVEDWKSEIDYSEKHQSLLNFLAVAVVEPEEKADGKRKLAKTEHEIIFTEAFFNGKPVQQKHTLKKKSDEWRKKYERIQAKRWKPETTKGLRRKPKFIFVPQEEAIGRLYDEMYVEASGFKDGVIPLRFKTEVIHYLFGSKLDEKK